MHVYPLRSRPQHRCLTLSFDGDTLTLTLTLTEMSPLTSDPGQSRPALEYHDRGQNRTRAVQVVL